MNRKHTESVSIKTASHFTGLPETTIRYWEKIGLISSERTKGGHRRYSRTCLEKLNQLKQDKQKQGIPATELLIAGDLMPRAGGDVSQRAEALSVNPLNKMIIQRELDIRFSKGTPTSACFIELAGREDFVSIFGQKGLYKILHFLAYLLDDTVRDYGKGEEKLAYLGEERYLLVTDLRRVSNIVRRLSEKFKQFINDW